jgi:predicted DNA-binding protein
MARTQTMVQLTQELVESLDALAERRSVSRSALIREFVIDGLQQSTAAAVGERIAEGYRRMPQALPDEWGDLAAASDIATRELMARLDAEERAAGHAPW